MVKLSLRELLVCVTVLGLLCSAALAQQTTTQGGDPITSALLWMQSILLGPIATALAVMAVAGVGFMMLTGRMNWRYGGTVIIGVFIIFGAPRLVATIAGSAGV